MTATFDPARIKTLREWLSVSTDDFAHLFGVGVATLFRWQNGQLPPDQRSAGLLEALTFLSEYPDAARAAARRRCITDALRIDQPLRATWRLLDFFYRNAPLQAEVAT